MNLTDYLKNHPKAITKLVQLGLLSSGHELPNWGADGLWGSESENALMNYLEVKREWPEDNTAALNAFYGTPDWENGTMSHQTYIEPPYPMYLAWAPEKPLTRIRCHAKVAASLSRALEGIRERLSLEDIKAFELDMFGGTTNVRPMRGSSRPSRHSWGIAIDLAPGMNGLHEPWPERATMPLQAIEAFEAEGWKSLARIIGRDAMHFQATQ